MYKARTVELLSSTRFYDPSLLQCAGFSLKMSGKPVFKTPGRFMDILIGDIFECTKQEQ